MAKHKKKKNKNKPARKPQTEAPAVADAVAVTDVAEVVQEPSLPEGVAAVSEDAAAVPVVADIEQAAGTPEAAEAMPAEDMTAVAESEEAVAEGAEGEAAEAVSDDVQAAIESGARKPARAAKGSSQKGRAARKAAADAQSSDALDPTAATEAGEGVADVIAASGEGDNLVDFESAAAALTEAEDEELVGEGEATSLDKLECIIESLLFASDKPLGTGDLKRIAGERGDQRIKKALEQLAEKRKDTGVRIVLTANGWRMQTNPENDQWVQRLVAGRPVRLSRAMMETLAIIAYKQPITRPEIDDIRGVDSGPVLKTLLDRNLVRVIGKKEEVGRPLLYGTTPEFLRVFNLKDLTELPTLREFHELGEDDKALVESTHGLGEGEGETLVEASADASATPAAVEGEATPAPEATASEGRAEPAATKKAQTPGKSGAHPFEVRPDAVLPDAIEDEDDSLLDELEEATAAVSRVLRDSRREPEGAEGDGESATTEG